MSAPWRRLACSVVLVFGACSSTAGELDNGASSTSTTAPNTASITAPPSSIGLLESTPEEQGMDSNVLADFVDAVVADGAIDSVTVIRHGHVVLDTVVYPFPEDVGHHLYSVTKSFIGTLIGIAIDRGLLAGVDVPVVEILPDLAPPSVDPMKASMTVEDLLTMSTGLECRDSEMFGYLGMVDMMTGDDWGAHILALPMIREPGTQFLYCNGASHLLSAILSEITGETAAEFAAEALFAPLGITDFRWAASPRGVTVGFADLVLDPLDMTKLGELYLRNGEWDGVQVVSPEWVAASTAPQDLPTGVPTRTGYGYQWWIDGSWVFAAGAGSQFVYWNPSLDLAVGFTAGLPMDRSSTPLELTLHHLLPSIGQGTLPPNTAGAARLEEVIAAARSGPDPLPAVMPEASKLINGYRFDFRQNRYGHEWFALEFAGDSARMKFKGAFASAFEYWPSYFFEMRGYEGYEQLIDVDVGLSGRFAEGELWGQPAGWRGRWVDERSFLVEFQMLGPHKDRGSFRFTFEGDTAAVVARETSDRIVEASRADRAERDGS